MAEPWKCESCEQMNTGYSDQCGRCDTYRYEKRLQTSGREISDWQADLKTLAMVVLNYHNCETCTGDYAGNPDCIDCSAVKTGQPECKCKMCELARKYAE